MHQLQSDPAEPRERLDGSGFTLTTVPLTENRSHQNEWKSVLALNEMPMKDNLS